MFEIDLLLLGEKFGSRFECLWFCCADVDTFFHVSYFLI